ncbi:MAG: hypothetical protein J0H14_18090 [Alphaproteobacteria bacterium]|nr:hypothetical protein [Alphaproteobacteria bacterium]
MYTVVEILLIAGVKFRVNPGIPQGDVFLTDANQLIGTFENLDKFRTFEKEHYKGWHRHHVVEADDLDRLGVITSAPRYEDQLCVLLPEAAHARRINSILRRANPTKWQASRGELRRAYADAYAVMGDYCGGGEAQIRAELLAIVDAEFQKLGIN